MSMLIRDVTYNVAGLVMGIAGKLGALMGASLFAPAADMWGESVVMVCCGCASLLALALTKICLGGGRAC